MTWGMRAVGSRLSPNWIYILKWCVKRGVKLILLSFIRKPIRYYFMQTRTHATHIRRLSWGWLSSSIYTWIVCGGLFCIIRVWLHNIKTVHEVAVVMIIARMLYVSLLYNNNNKRFCTTQKLYVFNVCARNTKDISIECVCSSLELCVYICESGHVYERQRGEQEHQQSASDFDKQTYDVAKKKQRRK